MKKFLTNRRVYREVCRSEIKTAAVSGVSGRRPSKTSSSSSDLVTTIIIIHGGSILARVSRWNRERREGGWCVCVLAVIIERGVVCWWVLSEKGESKGVWPVNRPVVSLTHIHTNTHIHRLEGESVVFIV
ncbi:hypothetical protein HanXRQr2_Chr16g0773371 [Helianthus annuus]|uniref:Uncharacterized protein n=1 Tax=Helianthus annuus TaxID=4232 RepID=A0A9K3H0R1_HELAN|nr:hypothetical protein HanXRQr2_Chr16g0773371 [Helianthus annuus]KAJ0823270.1 hypothetical protein HanPSC8_Chr16g0741781 [Helianthus annuus]